MLVRGGPTGWRAERREYSGKRAPQRHAALVRRVGPPQPPTRPSPNRTRWPHHRPDLPVPPTPHDPDLRTTDAPARAYGADSTGTPPAAHGGPDRMSSERRLRPHRLPRRMALAVAPVRGSPRSRPGRPGAEPGLGRRARSTASAEAELIALTNRSRANAGLKALKVDSTLRDDRPLAQQGHDRRRLLQPRHPGLRQGLRQARRDRLLLQARRREHRLEHLPRRPGDGRHPADVHGLVRPPREHPGRPTGT